MDGVSGVNVLRHVVMKKPIWLVAKQECGPERAACGNSQIMEESLVIQYGTKRRSAIPKNAHTTVFGMLGRNGLLAAKLVVLRVR